jgi:uncharacterized membrane protein YdjX (TVP38/TMEM64 family)
MDTSDAPATEPARNGIKLFVFIFLLLAIVVVSLFLPLNEWSVSLREQIRALGWMAPAAYVLIYVVFTVFLLAPMVLSLLSGSLFGWQLGVLLSLLGANIGALASFLLARTVMRQRVEEWAKSHPRFNAIDQAFVNNGLKLVMLLRLGPLPPFVLTNYFLGLTRIPLWKYILGTLLGMPPITCIVVYVGSLPAEAAAEWDSNRWMIQLAGAIAAVAAGALITVYARRAMNESTSENKS